MTFDGNLDRAATTEHSLAAQRLAQYVTRSRCERFLWLTLFPSRAARLFTRYKISPEPLSPLLSEAGLSFEREKVEELRLRECVIDLKNKSLADFMIEVRDQPAGLAFYDQPSLEGKIGRWNCEGRADLIRITRREDGAVDALVIDIKASRRETVGFRLQVAFYARLLEQALRAAGLAVNSVGGAIAKLDAEFTADSFNPFDLALYADEIERLVAQDDSDVARAVRASFETASYQLGPHCDGCYYNGLCFIDSAEREDLSLVPLLSASEKSALAIEGIKTARDLASLLSYGKGKLEPAPGRAQDVERISARWPLGSRLPLLAQRARAALNRYDQAIESKPYLFGADYGTLPDTAQYPSIVKVFLDAQRDYLEDHLYLIAGLIAGPAGSIEIVEMTGGPPDVAAERDLIVRFMQKLLPAIASVADSESAPLHVYLYDGRGQISLLAALERHFDALCAIPAFYDLLTSSPALTQGMISFLADEVRARRNTSHICQNLCQVASEMGFKWETNSSRFREIFRARVFDNKKPFERDPATGEFRSPASTTGRTLWVESNARFGTEIPLEYAYAAWGKLEETEEMRQGHRAHLSAFLGASADDIRAFAAHRCRALRHIEEKFIYKNKRVEKQPLNLARLDQVEIDPRDVPLSRSLEDFLYLEHHAALQERLLHFALPPLMRVETGRAAILRCDDYGKSDNGDEMALFSFADSDGELLPVKDIGALRFREGDWMTLNTLTDEDGRTPSAWSLIRGRLAVIEKVDDTQIALRLLSMSFKNSAFRYAHRNIKPEPGSVYVIDEMADDLNADKFLDACRNASSNHLYRWLENVAEGKRQRLIRPSRLREAEEIAALAAATQVPHGLTSAQRAIVGRHFTDRILVVQGPPGTGKSHTLGLAILARALVFATLTRRFRIAVAAKTHAATMIALESVARRAKELLEAHPTDSRFAWLRQLKVLKISNDPGEPVPDGVERVFAGGGAFRAGKQWEMLMAEPLLVIGGTPGGIYNMIKRGASNKRIIDWNQKYFDLVVVDEASQMGIAESLTSAAFLSEDGQFIAIGDHRQMPPILAHAWDRESRRDLGRARPHLSIFETLRASGFASAALDQSFRIPAEIADFLQSHIYVGDGIAFRSDNRRRLESVAGLEGWLQAALAPEHPLVVVEHNESGSQRDNRFEAALVEQLVRVARQQLGLDGKEGIGIVVPHRAQKAMLRELLPELEDAIDTVERFQGGERDLVIVSATVSDREFARLESNFLLEPRRLTVAISRPKRKLVVIASRAIFDLIPGDLDEYERGALWKYLRHECDKLTLWEGSIYGHRVSVRAMAQTPR